jgi:hypothetical protein
MPIATNTLPEKVAFGAFTGHMASVDQMIFKGLLAFEGHMAFTEPYGLEGYCFCRPLGFQGHMVCNGHMAFEGHMAFQCHIAFSGQNCL